MVTQIPFSNPTHLFPDQHQIVSDVHRRLLLSVQFTRLCERIGIMGKSYHCTRHADTSEKYRAIDKDDLAKRLAETLSMSQIRQLLGRSSAKTSKLYVHCAHDVAHGTLRNFVRQAQGVRHWTLMAPLEKKFLQTGGTGRDSRKRTVRVVG
jgi:hypothetical protein